MLVAGWLSWNPGRASVSKLPLSGLQSSRGCSIIQKICILPVNDFAEYFEISSRMPTYLAVYEQEVSENQDLITSLALASRLIQLSNDDNPLLPEPRYEIGICLLLNSNLLTSLLARLDTCRYSLIMGRKGLILRENKEER